MRYRAGHILSQHYGKGCYFVQFAYRHRAEAFSNRYYCMRQKSPKNEASRLVPAQQHVVDAVKSLTEVGRQWGQNSAKTISASINYWWGKYEEFVGLNEVRDAQTKVTEAEKAFMVARGMVREAHASLEALQGRLKEVRDRLDRVSREEAHYLELATSEHKLLQEERRLRTAYENAEEAERERFALFSVGVRESHEKERARAERTKNWSVIGSVLGALIGVMGSTYVNRVRLQELRSLLMEAQKGPVSLQEAIKEQAAVHKGQQEELRALIGTLREAVPERTLERSKASSYPATTSSPPTPLPSAIQSILNDILRSTQKAQTVMQELQPQLAQLEKTLGGVRSELREVRLASVRQPAVGKPLIGTQEAQVLLRDTEGVMQGLVQTEKRLESQINKTTLYNTVLTYTAFALSLPVLYLIFKGN
ncbi:mitochondrial potassium channel [Paramormyrops kingsleyae]|uniref:Coiled-coil domain containing 51 n=1 Tax=Paramormyrops kingsleyae TaxID=1676925 RepID=A0A3B3QUB9_9TELE|nr:coiled-coil domain-containing protein 51 [Paramormyrops kingsleyae]